jgi:hypothetical protein
VRETEVVAALRMLRGEKADFEKVASAANARLLGDLLSSAAR